ncbi:hypothetical protein COT72_01710 [archaeon CG10_big_fil_rev_8_21_14_0_10_43_11]|nr:MAG: hypothetical protein COT72_01710 [archaeon CG10_big_fil_rev_8_21_14_0_10_43_11]
MGVKQGNLGKYVSIKKPKKTQKQHFLPTPANAKVVHLQRLQMMQGEPFQLGTDYEHLIRELCNEYSYMGCGEVIFEPSFGQYFRVKNITYFNNHPTKEAIIIPKTQFVIQDFAEPKKSTRFTKEKNLTLDDVIGQDQAKQRARLICHYIEQPELFGSFPPNMNLFQGGPGTGKTYLARVIASQTKAPFFFSSATALVGNYIGESAKQIREFFEEALAKERSVVFVDEIDGIGYNRSKNQSMRGDALETVNALLVNLDEFVEHPGHVFIGATNLNTVLDRAVTSRLRSRIAFKPFSERERELFFKNYFSGVTKPFDVDFSRIAKQTPNYSGRDMIGLIEHAYHASILENTQKITTEDVLKQVGSGKKKSSPPAFEFV